LNDPQALDPQTTLQFTPPFEESLLTTAVSEVLPLTARLDGAGGANSIEIGCALIVSVALDHLVGLLVELA
jgi:hypothetical protein